MSWTTSLDELRALLNDGPQDRYRYRKKIFGEIGTGNLKFRTFEPRRVTDFTTAVFPLGVWLNGEPVDASDVDSDSPITGDFVLGSGVTLADGDTLEGSYYVQLFLDTELTRFITAGSKWLGFDTADTVPSGLQQAVLKYAAGEAYEKLCIRLSENASEAYLVEDAPQKENKSYLDTYSKLSKMFKELATSIRDEFYTRQGRSQQPLYGFALGHTSNPQPKQ